MESELVESSQTEVALVNQVVKVASVADGLTAVFTCIDSSLLEYLMPGSYR